MPEFAYGSGPPQPVAPMKPEKLADGVTLVRPLSRKGSGPGLILLTASPEFDFEIQDGIPSLRMKWAEEGYVVVEIGRQASSSALKLAVMKLDECQECEPKEKIGLVCGSLCTKQRYLSHMLIGVQAIIQKCGQKLLPQWRLSRIESSFRPSMPLRLNTLQSHHKHQYRRSIT